tara:strand:- start:19584 stop:22757 length:3174 start_codon:yes stop_codon:yes gene_type:complete
MQQIIAIREELAEADASDDLNRILAPKRNREGFALVISLSLMSLVMILTLLLSTRVQIETRSSAQSLRLVQSKQNAILAAAIALADLQRSAGPDQRTTARADLIDEGSPNPTWTGIWPTIETESLHPDIAAGDPIWLVSRSSADISPSIDTSADSYVSLVSAKMSLSGEDQTPPVRGEKLSIPNTSGSTSGSFAYWIGDEGIKTNVRSTEPESYTEFSSTSSDQLLRLQLAHQPRWEQFWGNSDRVTEFEISRVTTRESINLLSNFAPLQIGWNDLTVHSLSLLTDPREGGVKKDLTRILQADYSADSRFFNDQPIAPDHFSDVYETPTDATNSASTQSSPSWGILRSYHNLHTKNTTEGELLPTFPVHKQTSSQQGIFPVVGMIEMNFSAKSQETPVAEGSDQYLMQITIQPVVTLINPYDVALEPNDYTVLINYPAASAGTTDGGLIITDGNRVGPGKVFNPAVDIFMARPLHGPDAFGDGSWIEMEISSAGFEPGEARIFSLNAGGDFNIPAGGGPIPLGPGLNLIDFAIRDTNVTVSQSRLDDRSKSFSLRLRASSGPEIQLRLNEETKPLQKIVDVVYNSTTDYPFHLAEPGLNAIPNRMVLRHSAQDIVTTPGTTLDAESGARSFSLYNLRAPFSRKEPDINEWVTNPLYQGLRINPDVYGTTPFSDQNAFWGPSVWEGETHIPMFSVPRMPVISLGALQHSNVSLEAWFPGYAIGNSWASPYFNPEDVDLSYALNEVLWDQFFFSGLPDGLSDWPERTDWLNPRFTSLQEFTSDFAYDEELISGLIGIQGGFNINSTSVEAWTALLQSLQNLEVPFGRTASTIQAEPSNPADPKTPFPRQKLPGGNSDEKWTGFRSLLESETEALAEAIVEQIRTRGPFLSMSSFVNRDLSADRNSQENLMGSLQAAIENSGINEWWNDPSNDPQVPSFEERVVGSSPLPQLLYPEAEAGPRSAAAPGYFTQADLLQVLSPLIQTRSDTFTIRTYGSTAPSFNGDSGAETWMELVVQRLPDFVDDSQPFETDLASLNRVNSEFGRHFQVVSVRWIDEEKL